MELKASAQSAILKINFDSCAGKLRENSSKIFATSHGNSNYGEGWRLINEASRRKNSKQAILRAKSEDDLPIKWYNYFKGLLGKSLAITYPDKEVKTIFDKYFPLTYF